MLMQSTGNYRLVHSAVQRDTEPACLIPFLAANGQEHRCCATNMFQCHANRETTCSGHVRLLLLYTPIELD